MAFTYVCGAPIPLSQFVAVVHVLLSCSGTAPFTLTLPCQLLLASLLLCVTPQPLGHDVSSRDARGPGSWAREEPGAHDVHHRKCVA